MVDDNHIVRPMRIEDACVVLDWRNHEDIRRYMFCSDPIDLQTHLKWFKQSSSDPKRHLLIYEHVGRPLGFIQFTQESSTADEFSWGFYLSPDAPKGTGKHMGQTALRYAFHTIGATCIHGQVIAFNGKSVQFHLNLGFSQSSLLPQHHFDGTTYHDVICLHINKADWLTLNSHQHL